jgi:hypothetical protein
MTLYNEAWTVKIRKEREGREVEKEEEKKRR